MFTLMRPILLYGDVALLIFILEFKRITKHCRCGGKEEDFSVFALFAFNLKLIQLLYIMVCAMNIVF